MFHAWSTGNDRARVVLAVVRSKFRQRQYFLTQFTDMLFCYCYKCFFNILLTTTYFVNRHLYLNIMYRCCGSDRRNKLRVSVSD